MRFRVSWEVVESVPLPCPYSGPDAYGRISTISCAVLHIRYESKKMNKEFETKEEAVNFIEGANVPYGFSFQNGKLLNFSINEISE